MDSTATEAASSATGSVVDIAQIMHAIPHRYPFLMIDRIINVDGDNSAVGIKNVSVNEPMFQGHFPGHPIFPGVLIIEGMAQTAGAIAIHADKNDRQPLVYMVTVDKAKFRNPARPGDVLEYHIKKIKRRRAMGWYEAKAMVGDTLIAEAEVGAMIIEGE